MYNVMFLIIYLFYSRNMKKTVVIIEDDVTVVESLAYLLRIDGFLVHFYYSAEQFFMSKDRPDECVYLLDWNLPGIKGIDILRAIRVHDNVSPVFMVTAYDGPKQILEALELGADDYITKPFDYDALLAKVRNAYRKVSSLKNDFVNSGFHIMPEANAIMSKGVTVSLTANEFSIFSHLFKHSDGPVSRDVLIGVLEGDSSFSRNIDVYVSSLRKKIGKIGLSIETVRGIGYKLKGQV